MTYPHHPGEPQPSYPPAQPYGQPQQPPQQPQYGQPQQPYAQPGAFPPPPADPQFGAPGFAPAGFPPPPPPPPKKKSKALPIVLISLAIVLVLCGGGVAAVTIFAKDVVEDAGADAAKVAIAEPQTLGGLKKLEGEEFAALVKEMESGLTSIPGASDSFAAFYGDPDKDMVAALASRATILSPRTELTSSFTEFGDVKDIVAAETGTLGGVAECGTSSDPEAALAVCGWADEGSVGMILFYEKTAADVLAEFPKLRAEIETKSS